MSTEQMVQDSSSGAARKARQGFELTPEEQRHFADMRVRLAPALQSMVDIDAGVRGLTGHEERILNLLLDGHAYADIAVELGVPDGNVKKALYHIYTKFGVGNRAELSARIFRGK